MNERRIFERLIDVCEAATSDEALREALIHLARSAGFDCYAYFHSHQTDNYAISNYPMEWQRRYFSCGYMTIDPVITAAKRGTKAFRWSLDAVRSRACPQLRRFYTEAADFDLKSGLSVSISTGFGRIAIVTFASSSQKSPDGFLMGETAALATTAAAYVHARIATRDRLGEGRHLFDLSCVETACLRWSADGKTFSEIAEILGIKYGTVRFHVDSAKLKLGVYKLSQATAAAARNLLI
ncbi:putative transcriptional activator protein TraR [Ensifer adhaerens]|uniref:autoinducer binding domain-containing protein n=1 Tax=Ensifer adhaerens TaxID=106592 RepID=UPI00156875F2|nr:autoinducer binding domain-containing protein [Ensifer adhaerens]NRP21817.1 putative transcriptional activator protein TraR [Ensifer adhaerens]